MGGDRLILMASSGPCPTMEVAAPYAAAYAARMGADFIAHNHENHHGAPLEKHNFVKVEIDRLSRHYRQVVWLDADTVVMPWAPDIFAEVPEGRLGAWCGEGRVFQEGEARPRPLYRHGYFNAGVMVWPSAASGLMGKAVEMWRRKDKIMTRQELAGLFGEQTALNRVVDEAGIPVHDLDVRWNHFLPQERCEKHGLPPVDQAWIVHFAGGAHTEQAGMGKPERWDQVLRARLMKEWLKEKGLI